MQKDPSLRFRLCLMLSDALAFVAAFVFAYYTRTHIDQRPYTFEAAPLEFALTILSFIPAWIIILAFLGLYQKSIFLGKPRIKETWRLLIASVIGVMFIITFDFFDQGNLFPVRVIAIYAAILCFLTLAVFRAILRFVRSQITKRHVGTLRAVIIGNHQNTDFLANYISTNPESGYTLVGIVANNRYIPKGLKRTHQYSSLKDALKRARPDVVFQTDERQTEYVYKQSVNHHLLYYFVPSESALSSHIGQLELIGNTRAILVKVTPLSGGAKVVKRITDIITSGLALLIALIPMIIIWIVVKLSNIHAPAINSSIRLSQFNHRFKCYKFRSMKPEFDGLTPEQAFIKIGKPELIKKYRKNGDYLRDDPRVTKIGNFLRRTSLDELPQLFNVFKGDISLVGPRALVPGELRNYGDRSLLLSVKSGLTGLAQVSGRRDISFEERRALDIYYIQNWSLLLDFQILLRTIGTVFTGEGAK